MNERPTPDERAAFDRDGHACTRCGAGGEEIDLVGYHVVDGVAPSRPEGESRSREQRTDDQTASSTDVPSETDAAHRNPRTASLATICADCHALLEGAPPEWYRRVEREPAAGVLGMLRAVTTEQGGAVATVADFAAAATGGVDADESADRRRYLDDWRSVNVELAAVDRHLAAAKTLEATALPESGEQALESVQTLASELQERLERVLVLAETAIAAEGRCHACLGELDGADRCPACATAVRETAEWETDDGTVALADLYGAVNEQLGRASAKTGTLTDRTGDLAELLVERSES